MKRIILTAVLAISTVGMFAQTSGGGLTSKKGEVYLPESGDWAIGFDANPFLTYFGQFLGNANVAPQAGFLNSNQTIIGKYFVDDHTAYRALIRIGIDHSGQDNLVTQDGYTGAPPVPFVTDHWSYSTHFIGLGAGMEMRRGKTRLQGYYGAEFMFYLMGSSNAYTYGNAFSSTNTTPTSTLTWGATPTSGATGSRVTEMDMGSTFGINLLGFIGCEYFVIPKVSIGAEYTWGVMFSSTGQGTTTTESWSGTADQSTTTHSGGTSMFGFDTGINTAFSTGSGHLYINFHF
jgi:hypothetical protein